MAKIDAYDIIVRPVISEKSTLASEANQVIFDVRKEATKPAIKQAVEQLSGVRVTLESLRESTALVNRRRRVLQRIEQQIDVVSGSTERLGRLGRSKAQYAG